MGRGPDAKSSGVPLLARVSLGFPRDGSDYISLIHVADLAEGLQARRRAGSFGIDRIGGRQPAHDPIGSCSPTSHCWKAPQFRLAAAYPTFHHSASQIPRHEKIRVAAILLLLQVGPDVSSMPIRQRPARARAFFTTTRCRRLQREQLEKRVNGGGFWSAELGEVGDFRKPRAPTAQDHSILANETTLDLCERLGCGH